MNIGFDECAVVLAISGHDPTGGAGVQADVETITGHGVRCATLITATTIQSTARFEAVHPQPAARLLREAELLISDMKFSACKIGLLGSVETVNCVAEILRWLPDIPVVLDPVSHAGAGTWTAAGEIIHAIGKHLVPHCTIITPNQREARELAGESDPARAAGGLLARGAAGVLLTGTDEHDPDRPDRVINRLFRRGRQPVEFPFPRLPDQYHGSGCTLSSALAARLAMHTEIDEAVRLALEYTWTSLKHGRQLGHGQWHPDRVRIYAET
ncbi:MAG: hydroxymethylpyrimidine/phosphomethylpyrimidine kinase [Gammaproteobacteria bacterium]|nr:hydroxymethylpyrimidine/phosphomethylpyrimidine kinase [Gammaproteobacteria bacterium]